MSSQDVFWINTGLGVAFLALFMIRRGSRQPTRLNLRAGEASKVNTKGMTKSRLNKRYDLMSDETLEAQSLTSKEKVLNVLFNYNGHTWDAFEILGLPAGSSLKAVEEAYQKAAAQSSPESRDFIDSAFQAIRSRSPQSRTGA